MTEDLDTSFADSSDNELANLELSGIEDFLDINSDVMDNYQLTDDILSKECNFECKNLIEMNVTNSESIQTTTSTTINQNYNDDKVEGTEDYEKKSQKIELSRLEVDYVVVSHLYTIHKRKAKETKREAYRIAYKSNLKRVS